jgi:hypothetical protein
MVGDDKNANGRGSRESEYSRPISETE